MKPGGFAGCPNVGTEEGAAAWFVSSVMLSSFIWSFPWVLAPNPVAGFKSPNAGVGVARVEKAVVADEVNEKLEAGDGPNVKGEPLEPEVDKPNENPVDGEVLEVETEVKRDDVGAWELELNGLAVAVGVKDELLLTLEEPVPAEKENPELELKGLALRDPNGEVPKEGLLKPPNEGDEENKPNWLVELCESWEAPILDWAGWLLNIDPELSPKTLAVELGEELLANNELELVDPPVTPEVEVNEFWVAAATLSWEEIFSSGPELLDWAEAVNPKTLLPALGKADENVVKLLPAALENNNEDAGEPLAPEFIRDAEGAREELSPLLEIVTNDATSEEPLLTELGNTTDAPWDVALSKLNGSVLTELAGGIAV